MRYTQAVVVPLFLATVAIAPTVAGLSPASAAPTVPVVSARVCRLMPTRELAGVLGKRPTRVTGTDSDVLSTCTALFANNTVVKTQYAKPGRP